MTETGWKTLRGNRPSPSFEFCPFLSLLKFKVHCDKAVSLVQKLSCLSLKFSQIVEYYSFFTVQSYMKLPVKVISYSDWMVVTEPYGSAVL